MLHVHHTYFKCQCAVRLLYSLDKRCHKTVRAKAGNIYRMTENICWGQDGLIFCDTPLSEKCFSRNADGILILC